MAKMEIMSNFLDDDIDMPDKQGLLKASAVTKNTNYYNNPSEAKPIAIEFNKNSHETLNITHDYQTDRLPVDNLYQS